MERLTAVAPDEAPKLWIGTFHAFGLDLIRRYHDKFDLPPDPPLFDRSDAIEVLEEGLPTLPLVHYRNLWDPALVLRDIVGAISRAKDARMAASLRLVLRSFALTYRLRCADCPPATSSVCARPGTQSLMLQIAAREYDRRR